MRRVMQLGPCSRQCRHSETLLGTTRVADGGVGMRTFAIDEHPAELAVGAYVTRIAWLRSANSAVYVTEANENALVLPDQP